MINREKIKKSVILPMVIAFILLNILARQDGATNEMSRFATMRSMSDQLSFQINEYKDWTVDWSQAPNGNYYSNKPPGAMLIAFPLFYIIDQFSKFDRKQVFKDGLRLTKVTSTPRVIISIIYQLLPFSLICIILTLWARKKKVSDHSIQFGILAMMFGNTASIFMNFYFGHGLTAVLLLFSIYYMIEGNYRYLGFFYGLSLLNDYSVALLLPIYLFIILKNERKINTLKDFIIGGTLPGILWVWYHQVCFGSPFKIPNMFQNPRFQDVKESTDNLWGIFHLGISSTNFIKLLFGTERGILFTQPWALVVILQTIFLAIKKKLSSLEKDLGVLSILGFTLLLIMNAQFGGWHGGGTSGPRYISIIIPIIGFLGIFIFDKSSRIIKTILTTTLAFSVVFRAIVYGSRATAINGHDLWPYLIEDMLNKPNNGGLVRLSLFIILTSIGFILMKRRQKNIIE